MDLLAPLPSKTISVEIVELVGTGRFIALATSNTNMKNEDTLAYQIGFSDGLEYGYEKRNKYKRAKEKQLYRMGYDAGVSEYCHQEHPEDEESLPF
jgi:hypothetical protein